MKPATSKSQIKKRVDAYLWKGRSLPLIKLRRVLAEDFSSMGRVAVIGGLIRDLAQVGSAGFKSDIDLVVDQDQRTVDDFARSVGAIKNRFGGYRYSPAGWHIDFWALKNTWASVQGHVQIVEMEDLIRCTFFTTDAMVYMLDNRSLITKDEYVSDLVCSRLEINLLPNPSPEGNLVRTVRRVLSRGMTMGPKLTSFVCNHLNTASYNYVVDTELRLYGHSYAQRYRDPRSLVSALISAPDSDSGEGMQYSLPIKG